ncbi:protein kinase [bacterium]|nr:protein kinase [bacterium]
MNQEGEQERWQRVKELLAAALEQPEAERNHFLDEVCSSDHTLRAELESLLSYEESQDRLSEPAISMDAFKQRDRIGPYKIIRTLGHGGMGNVYLAARADDEYRKEVAIKFIRQDASSDFILHRFRNERQILAALDHPHMARLLDGGTADGVPYLVMDYIEGLPIHEYCDQNKLNTEKRLHIFLQLCAAVHYAHQRLVIHRDIKPSNILVTKEGVPKLLDFGIAKLMAPELAAQTLDATGTAIRLMTPEYASPEQTRGELITTASDVYSLGVVLYELLTGHSPYRTASNDIHDLLRAVSETEPEKPSTAIQRTTEVKKRGNVERITVETVSRTREGAPDKLYRRLRGDLDNIVLKALRKEPGQRYSSVEQFREDIQRHLDGLPVFARKPTLVYRAKKFIRRNRAGVAAVALIINALAGSILAINQQRVRAERRFNDVRRLAHAVVFDYHDAIADLPGSTPVRQRLIKDALQYLDSLADEAKDDRELQRELAKAYVKIGDVQGNSYVANLGNPSGALISYRKSLAIRETLSNAQPDNIEWGRERAESHERIGNIFRTSGDVKEADQSYHRAIGILQNLSVKMPRDQQTRRNLAKLFYHVANLRGMARGPNLGDITGSIDYHQRAIKIREALCAEEPNNLMLRVELQDSHGSLSDIFLSIWKLAEAKSHVYRAIALAESLVQAEPRSLKAQQILMGAQDSLGRLLQSKGELMKAQEVYLNCLNTAQSMLAIDPSNKQFRLSLAARNLRVGVLLMDQNEPARALQFHREALKLNEEVAATDPTNDAARRVIALDHLNLGEALCAIGDFKEALLHNHQARKYFEVLRKKNPRDRSSVPWLMRTYNQIGVALLKQGDHKPALENLHRSLALAKSAGSDPNIRSVQQHSAMAFFQLGETHVAIAKKVETPANQKSSHWNEARQVYQRSLDLFSRLKQKETLKLRYADMPERIPRKIEQIGVELK